MFSGPDRIEEVNATIQGLAADFEGRNDAAIEALLTHSVRDAERCLRVLAVMRLPRGDM